MWDQARTLDIPSACRHQPNGSAPKRAAPSRVAKKIPGTAGAEQLVADDGGDGQNAGE